jgi:hypothetical protein
MAKNEVRLLLYELKQLVTCLAYGMIFIHGTSAYFGLRHDCCNHIALGSWLGARRAFLQTQPVSSQALVEGFQRCSLLRPEKVHLSGGIPIRQLPAPLDAT